MSQSTYLFVFLVLRIAKYALRTIRDQEQRLKIVNLNNG